MWATHISMQGDRGAIGITIKACTIKGAKSIEDIMEAGLSRLLRDAPPTHFRFKIESFSSLPNSSLERVESCEFKAGDYKWKLAIYPRGNKAKDVKDHISLYLVWVNNNSDNKEILVTYSLFVFDHIQYKYLPVQGASRFHATKPESGLDKFLTLKIFNEPSNGNLIDDTCIFGAELFFIKSTVKGQCLSMIKYPGPFKHVWKIEKFSKLKDELYYSDTFTTKGHDWRIELYLNGYQTEKGQTLSMFLELAHPEQLSPGMEVLAEYTFRVIDQVNQNHKELKGAKTISFSASSRDWGYPKFLPLSELNRSTGYVVDDVCVVEAEVDVRGTVKNWD